MPIQNDNVTPIKPGTIALSGGNGGGDMSGDGVNSRLDRLESSVEHIRADLLDFKTEVRGWRSELAEDMREHRQDFKNLRHQIWAGVLAVLVGVIGAMYSQTQTILATVQTVLQASQSQQPQQPPIIINVPPSAPQTEPKTKH